MLRLGQGYVKNFGHLHGTEMELPWRRRVCNSTLYRRAYMIRRRAAAVLGESGKDKRTGLSCFPWLEMIEWLGSRERVAV